MKPHLLNDSNLFIGGWYLDDTSLCDDIVEYHKLAPDKHAGRTGRGVVPESKKSTDCDLAVNYELLERYLASLQLVCNTYMEKYPYCNKYAPWGITESVPIQHYKPTEGYYVWHSERTHVNTPTIAARHLVFMTYLNDVTDGGQTEFYHQQLKVQPEKGLTLIWPADWTFTHRGITSPTQDKYIVTGWFNYMHADEPKQEKQNGF
jgi:hypothetical protein